MLTYHHDTVIGNIPEDWHSRPLRELIKEQFSGDWGADEGECAVSVLRSTNFTSNGALDFSDVATRYFNQDKADTFVLKKGDILVERSGGGPDQPVGRTGFITEDLQGYTVSNFVQVLRPDTEKIDPEFLGWILYELQRTGIVERVQQQSTQMRNLNWRDYQRLLLPWPELDEQHRIVEILKLAYNAIDKVNAELRATRELKESLMQKLFISGVPGRHSEFVGTKIGLIPKGWEVKRIGKVLIEPPVSGISPQSRPEPPGIPILNVSCVKDGICDPSKVTYVDVTEDDIERYRAEVGDFFVLRGNGNREYVASGGLLREKPPDKSIYSDKLIRIRFDTSKVAFRFVPYMWQSHKFLKRLQSKAESGSGLWMMSKRDIVREFFAYPPISEQEAIVKFFDGVETQLIAQVNKFNALQQIKRSLLQTLLTGKIRIPEGAIHE
jgi:type I restriction enzyme, S subunit